MRHRKFFPALCLLFITACSGGLQEAYEDSQKGGGSAPKIWMITTVAGNGENTSDPLEEESATETPFFVPRGVAVAPNGDFYVSMTVRHCVFKVEAGTQKAIRVAGTCGTSGSPVAGFAIDTKLDFPYGLALDAERNILYIADTYNDCVQKVNLNDGNSEVVVSGLNQSRAVAVDGDGNLYISSYSSGTVTKVLVGTTNQTQVITGLQSYLSNPFKPGPHQMAVDGFGNVYVADSGRHCVKKYNSAGVLLSTVAGTCGSSGNSPDGVLAENSFLNTPYGLALDGRGSLFIMDNGNNLIRRLDLTTGMLSIIAGGGSNTAGDGILAREVSLNLEYSTGLTADSRGDLYIADASNHRVRKIFWQ